MFDSRCPFNLDTSFTKPPGLDEGGDLIEKGPLWVADALIGDRVDCAALPVRVPQGPVASGVAQLD